MQIGARRTSNHANYLTAQKSSNINSPLQDTTSARTYGDAVKPKPKTNKGIAYAVVLKPSISATGTITDQKLNDQRKRGSMSYILKRPNQGK